jgi:uncharacterized protein
MMPAMASADPRIAPAVSSARSRVEMVDMLRGLALLGMLAVHFQYYPATGGVWSERIGDVVSHAATGKFYPLFGCLFGVGFALQFERWGERAGFAAMYLRRLVALFAIAMVVIGFTGFVVLELYAVFGLGLLLVRRWSNRALLVAALVCIFANPVQRLVSYEWEVQTSTPQQSNEKFRQRPVERQAHMKQELALQGEQKLRYGQIVARALGQLRRAQDMYVTNSSYLLPTGPVNVLPLFLVGVYAVRRRVFQDPQRHRRLLWTTLIVGASLGITTEVLPGLWQGPAFQPDNVRPLLQAAAYRRFPYAVLFIGENMWLGLAYAAGLMLLIGRFALVRRAATLLSYAGRMSLTNYVMQVVILELVFAWGTSPPSQWAAWPAITRHGVLALWSLHIPITRPMALVATFVFFGLQILFSRWWMRHFRYGPLEWLWRSMTYARWQPMRYAPAVTPTTP